jgi:MFS family permease
MLTPGSWPCIILLVIYGTVATSLVTQSVPVIGDIAQFFHLSRATAGWVISIPSLITAVFSLFGGWLIDKLGDKRVIFAGSLCALIGNLGVFFAQDVATLFSSRLLQGLGYMALTVGAVTLIMRTTTGSRRHIAIGLWTAHTAVGIGVTLSIVAPLAQKGELWRWAFGGHAILMAVLVLGVVLLPGKTEATEARRLSDIWLVARTRRPYRLAFASASSAFIQTGIMAALTVYMSKTFAVSVKQAAGVGTLAEVFVVLACFAIGYLLKAGWKARTLAIVGGIGTLIGGVVLYLPASDFTQAAFGICLFSAGIGLLNSLIWTFVPQAAPTLSSMGATNGLVAQGTYLGVLLGPPAIFATLHEGGWSMRVGLVIVATLLQMILVPVWGRRNAEAGPELRPQAGPLRTL